MEREFAFEPMMENKDTSNDLWQLLDVHPSPTALISVSTLICQYANPAFEELLGFATMSGTSIEHLIHPEDDFNPDKEFQSVRLQHHDGSYLPYQVTLKSISDQQQILTLRSTTKITIEHDILNAFPGIAIIVFDREYRYLVAAGGALTEAGMDDDTIIGRTLYQVLPTDLVEILEPFYADVFEGITNHLERTINHKVYEMIFRPVRDHKGNIKAGMIINTDISHQRLAEQALLDSVTLNQAILDALPDILLRIDRDGQLIDIFTRDGNDLIVHGSDFVGNHITSVFSEHLVTRILEDVQFVLTEKAPHNAEYEVQNAFSELRIVPFKEDEVLCLIRNVTERKHMEMALRESEKRYRELFEGINDIIIVHDLRGNILDVNELACERLQSSREALLSQMIFDIADVNYIEGIYSDMKARGGTGNLHVSDTVRLTLRDGHDYDVNTKLITYQDKPAMLAVYRDISDRIHAEEALRESEKRFRLLAETIEDVFWIRSLDFKETYYVSPAFEQVWGIPIEEYYKNPECVFESIHEHDREEYRKAMWSSQDQWMREYRIVRPDSNQRWIRERGYRIYNDEGIPQQIVSIASDITQEKRIAHLKAAGEISVGVAHQINNPLTTVIVQSSRMMNKISSEHPLHEAAQDTYTAANQAAQIVQRLLNLARGSLGEMTRIDINDSVQTAINLLRPQIEPEAAQIILDLKENLPTIWGNDDYLQDVWTNLLLNARDAIAENNRKGVIKVGTVLNQTKQMIEVTVYDNGKGITSDELDHIFKPFISNKAHGTGLGLAICHDIIMRHQGFINVYSRENYGTIFSIMLPVSGT